MGVDETKIGFTFKSRRVSRAAQEMSLRAGGAQVVKHCGTKGCATWRVIPSTLRPGDTVYIDALVLVPTEPEDDDVPPSGQPAEFLLEMHHYQATVIECRTGRNSRKRSQRQAMIADAVKGLRSGGRRMPKSSAPSGRKRRAWPSDEIKSQALKIWKSRVIASDLAAIRHAMEMWPDKVTERMMRGLGPSGRRAR